MTTFELLRPYVRRHWRALAGAALSSLVVAAADLARPWPIKLVVDELFDGGDVDLGGGAVWLLLGIAALVLLIALSDACASYLADLWLGRAGEGITHDLRVSLYDHLQRLSLRFHQSRSKGDLVTRVTGDANAVGELFSDTLGTVAQSAIVVVGMLAVSLALDPVVGLAVFAVMPPLALVSFRYRRKLKAAARRQRAQEGAIASLATEALSAMPVVKAMGSERFEQSRRSRPSRRMRPWSGS